MTHTQRLENEKWFNKIIEYTKEGGNYVWPDEKETYIIKNGKLIGKKSAITKLKNITTKKFHSKLVVK
jgi:hypothetical protein